MMKSGLSIWNLVLQLRDEIVGLFLPFENVLESAVALKSFPALFV